MKTLVGYAAYIALLIAVQWLFLPNVSMEGAALVVFVGALIGAAVIGYGFDWIKSRRKR